MVKLIKNEWRGKPKQNLYIICRNRLYTFFFTIWGVGYYKSVTIPDNLINIIQHNLESTPIMDILFDNQCENNNTSNLLGYYYGFDSGFIYNNKSYNKKNRKKICKGNKISALILTHNLKFFIIYLKVKNYAHQKDQIKIILIMLSLHHHFMIVQMERKYVDN